MKIRLYIPNKELTEMLQTAGISGEKANFIKFARNNKKTITKIIIREFCNYLEAEEYFNNQEHDIYSEYPYPYGYYDTEH